MLTTQKEAAGLCRVCKADSETLAGLVFLWAWLIGAPLLQSLSAPAAWLAARCASC